MKPIKYKIPFTETPNQVHEIPMNEIDILADDGRTLFTLQILDDGVLMVQAGGTAKHDDNILQQSLVIQPIDGRRIRIERLKIEKQS